MFPRSRVLIASAALAALNLQAASAAAEVSTEVDASSIRREIEREDRERRQMRSYERYHQRSNGTSLLHKAMRAKAR